MKKLMIILAMLLCPLIIIGLTWLSFNVIVKPDTYNIYYQYFCYIIATVASTYCNYAIYKDLWK